MTGLEMKQDLRGINNGVEGRKIWNIGMWNVRGLAGREEELIWEFEKAKVDLLLLSETKVKGRGLKRLKNDHGLLYSGVDRHVWGQAGVACLVHRNCMERIQNWEFVNERIMEVKYRINEAETATLLVVYGPNESEEKEVKESFWNCLQGQVEKKHGLLLIGGDLNGRVGNNGREASGCIGKYGEPNKNSNGQRIIDFCTVNNLFVANTFFQHADIHKYTRIMESRQEKSIIDLLLMERSGRKRIKDVRVKRQYEIGSDHHFVSIQVKANIQKEINTQAR